jgi:predicted RNA binding protein YcfA (HicA-like mRNA interferase family)
MVFRRYPILVTPREVMRIIERNGAVLLRQRGSHRQYEARIMKADGTELIVRTTIAQHSGDIRPGTLRAIERDLEPVFGKGWLRNR